MTLEHATDTGIQFFSATQTQLRFGDAASTGAGSIIYTHSDNTMKFSTAESESIRITDDGLSTANNHQIDILDGSGDVSMRLNNLSSAQNSGRISIDPNNSAASSTLAIFIDGTEEARIDSDGLKFNGDTAAANALDDYEEGAWTPTANNGSFTGIIQGRYTKVGNKVTAWGYIQGINDTSTSSILTVGGLPYPAVSSGSLESTSGSIMLRYLDVGVTEEIGVNVYLSGGSTALRIYVLQAGGTYTAAQNAHFNNGGIGFRLNITYQV